MRILLLGGTGMLGSDVLAEASERGLEVVAPGRDELDITRADHVGRIPAGEFGSLDWVVNCAAYTAVDRAEEEPDAAALLNSYGPAILAHACGMADVRLLHVSTDFVFDGRASAPYVEDAPTNPLGVYGRTKLEGEQRVMESLPNAVIVRTSWLYGPNGASFPRTIIRAWLADKDLRVVADQLGTPTYTADLARAILDLIALEPSGGVYHAAGRDLVSWHEFAVQALEAYSEVRGETREIEIEAIGTEDWPTPAQRPKFSALSTGKLDALGVRPWRPLTEALRDFCRRLPSSDT